MTGAVVKLVVRLCTPAVPLGWILCDGNAAVSNSLTSILELAYNDSTNFTITISMLWRSQNKSFQNLSIVIKH